MVATEARTESMKYAVELFCDMFAEGLKWNEGAENKLPETIGEDIGKAVVKAAEQIEKYINV